MSREEPQEIDPLGPALRSVVSEAIEQCDRVQGEPPGLLVHYTDVAGLIVIPSPGRTTRSSRTVFYQHWSVIRQPQNLQPVEYLESGQ